MSQPTTKRIGRRQGILVLGSSLAIAGLILSSLTDETTPGKGVSSPEERAISYLGTEVPRWQTENHCYSCHNNGDGARGLMAAQKAGYSLAPGSLDNTQAWLAQPTNWDHNGGEGGFSDKVLARIQFARALADTKSRSRAAASAAAAWLARDQQPDGSWKIDDGGTGSPCTYGNALATAQACQVIELLTPGRHAAAIERAERWLVKQERHCVLDAVAVLFGVNKGFAEIRQAAVEELLATQGTDGGWGLYPVSPTEPFDTAVAMLALARCPRNYRIQQALARGRDYLVAAQQPDGGWIETTRPAGAVSYAQRLSTTGWATLALLATRARDGR
ncbi:hypothetical protein BH10PLA2_BH10PLA2_35340 [soil metagenome]